MVIFAVNGSHTPESCPMFNEEVKKKLKETVAKRKEVAEKHGVKILSSYVSRLDHRVLSIVEAPSQEAVENYYVEAGLASWSSIEIRQVKSTEDVIKKVLGE